MKKRYVFLGMLLVGLTAGLMNNMAAQPKKKKAQPVLLEVKNNTSDGISVVIKGHGVRNNLANALRIPKGGSRFVIVGRKSRRGPFIVARAKDLAEHRVGQLGTQRFTVAFELPTSSYIFPIGRFIFMGRAEGAPEYGTFFNSITFAEVEGGLALKAKRTFPMVPFWEKKWDKLQRKELPLSTEGEPIITW